MTINNYFNHKLIQNSYWPLIISLSLFVLVLNVIIFLVSNLKDIFFYFSFILPILIIFLWFKDINRERLIGYHITKYEINIRIGFIFFIVSEIIFFFSFFWCFFDGAISPSIEYGIIWPPKGIISISFYSVPLLNTLILLRRGVSITW